MPPKKQENLARETVTTAPTKKERPKAGHQKKAMLEALEKSLGVVTTACKLIGVDRKTHYRWMDKDPKYKAKVIEMSEIALDFAESRLHVLIKEGDTAATIFYLKTRGKQRGYVERQETTGADGQPLEPPKQQVFIIGGKEITF